ncbi:MAG: hypothetical protein E7672_01665 [Ruminococcaceae bacterium]|nr:hypothetical protein [Oscillospiraceae bacterium]
MKKLLCMILAFLMALSLVACGGSGDPADPDNDKSENNQKDDNKGEDKPVVDPVTGEITLDEPFVLVQVVSQHSEYTQYFYDESGRITKEVITDGKNGPVIDELVYNYSEEADGTLVVGYAGLGIGNGEIKKFNSDGYCIEVKNYSTTRAETPEEILDESHYMYGYRFEYDSENRLSKVVTLSDDGTDAGWTEIAYNENGDLASRVSYRKDGSFNYGDYFEYDQNGDALKRTRKGSNEYTVDYTWELSTGDNGVSQRKVKGGDFILNYHYDENGNFESLQVSDDYGVIKGKLLPKDSALLENNLWRTMTFMPLSVALAKQNSAE